MKRAVKPPIAPERVVDTLVLARRKHPGGHNTLDDLCSRYDVNSLRSRHVVKSSCGGHCCDDTTFDPVMDDPVSSRV
jgi:DNA polymerase III epsilon subunit-like protein